MLANRAKDGNEELMMANKLAFSRFRRGNLTFDVISGQASPVGYGFHGDRSHRVTLESVRAVFSHLRSLVLCLRLPTHRGLRNSSLRREWSLSGDTVRNCATSRRWCLYGMFLLIAICV